MSFAKLDIEELDVLETRIIDILNDEGLLSTLIRLNTNERLEDFLDLLGHPELLEKNEHFFHAPSDGKIIILGQSSIRDADIISAFKEYGISKDRIELHTEYNLGGFNVDVLRYSPSYSLILFGPVPHSIQGKGNHSSLITTVEQEQGYTHSIRLSANGELKITKTSLKEAIQKAITNGWIVVE